MNLYTEISRIYSGEDENILKLINVFKKITSGSVDFNRTKIFIENDFINVYLFALSDKHCGLSFMIGINSNLHKLFFDFIEDVNILYYEDFSSEVGLEDIIDTIAPILESTVKRNEYYVKSKLCKTVITCDKYKIDDEELIKFEKNYKSIWFFQKPIKKEIIYSPWIEP